MSKQAGSNIIHIDFSARKSTTESSINNSAQSFSQLLSHVIPTSDHQYTDESQDKWAEQLTPSERREQLKKDLEFIRNLED